MQQLCLLCLLYMIYHATDVVNGNMSVNFNINPCENDTKCDGQPNQNETSGFRRTTESSNESIYAQEKLTTHPQTTLQPSTKNKLHPTVRLKYQYERPYLSNGGVLYPRVTESRDLILLDGVWSFILGSQGTRGVRERWFEQDLTMMSDAIMIPVPCSYNDVTTDAAIQDHVGVVWYQRSFIVPASWKTKQQRVWMRFGSVHYFAQVWINGQKVMEHEVGHLPFQGDVTEYLSLGKNTITVSVDNRLGPETIPQGTLEPIDTIRGPKEVQKYSYGFYNYAGIHGSVHLYTTPRLYIDNISLESKFNGSDIFLLCKVSYKGAIDKELISIIIKVIDMGGKISASTQTIIDGHEGYVYREIKMKATQLWWPYLMHSDPGYLYNVQFNLTTITRRITDIYTTPFGFRDLRWDEKSIFINNKSIYIRGSSRHEDFNVRGRGLDIATSLKDLYLAKWIGFNTLRTSHCPYPEEVMDMAEKMGLMVINEVPSINTQNFTDTLLIKHRLALEQLINRDRNRACVIMWSVANEPVSEAKYADVYFGAVTKFARQQDNTRPITAVLNRWNTVDKAGQWMDIICFNRYNGYFKEPGRWEIILLAVVKEAEYWYDRHRKPVIMSEYGSETYEGLHSLPESLWTEEYLNKLLTEHFKAFDILRNKEWFVGDIVYSFADFKTDQSTKRVGSEHRKGIFNRQRQPKSSAFYIKTRNFRLAAILNNETCSSQDLNSCTCECEWKKTKKIK